MTGYDPEEYQEVVERHHRIDSERRKLKQETKETKRIEDEEILKKKKNEKDGKKLSREKRREELAARLKTSDAVNGPSKKGGGKGDDGLSESEKSGSDSDSDSDSDYDRYVKRITTLQVIQSRLYMLLLAIYV